MRTNYRLRQFVRFARIIVGSAMLLTVAAVPALHAQSDDEFDSWSDSRASGCTRLLLAPCKVPLIAVRSI